MIRSPRSGTCVLLLIACMGICGCVHRPKAIPVRMIEPQLLAPQSADPETQAAKSPNAASVRLLSTQARGHIGHPVLHEKADGELIGDPVWRWSSRPDQYLDTALRLEAARRPDLRLVDSGRVPELAATLLVWDLESTGGTKLVGAVEFQITGADGVINTQLVRASEQVSAELPGNLADAAGHLLRRLAAEGLALVTNK
jgi:hypothetical protein